MKGSARRGELQAARHAGRAVAREAGGAAVREASLRETTRSGREAKPVPVGSAGQGVA